ncbi:MAG: hypothetical protein DCC55_34260 [Chloroflexi bacterium]|nr:MAG: hypothetical protein DCC55_34260 [Chloroflexota bacterium]
MESKQGRFAEGRAVWSSFVELGRTLHERAQPRAGDVQGLDTWMQEVLYCDPVLPGMIAKLTSAFAGQGWKIIGPARTAKRAAFVLENADGGRGWFHFAETCAKSYLMRNMGCFVEVVHLFEPEVDEGTGELRSDLAPVTALYNMDSTKARWVRDKVYPLRYESKPWSRFDFFHLVDNPGDTDATRRRGQCALYRCLEYVKLMGLINAWEQGNLDPDFVDAILLLQGASDEQFGAAMNAREKAIDEKGNAAKRLAVLANEHEELQAELLFLRRRPESLEDFEARVRMIYEVYALNLGRDVTYWFPSQYAGRAYRTRSEVQSEERQAVESNTFHPKLQEALQRYVMPQTVHFTFDNPAVSDRDYLFRLREFVELGKTLYTARQVDGEHLATKEEIRRFLAEADGRFEEWTWNGPRKRKPRPRRTMTWRRCDRCRRCNWRWPPIDKGLVPMTRWWMCAGDGCRTGSMSTAERWWARWPNWRSHRSGLA